MRVVREEQKIAPLQPSARQVADSGLVNSPRGRSMPLLVDVCMSPEQSNELGPSAPTRRTPNESGSEIDDIFSERVGG
jgi:hypothetical protein